jgi:hypothetical protein
MIPRGALVRYREWYGALSPNVGLKMPAEEVADGIKERERGALVVTAREYRHAAPRERERMVRT